MTLAVAPPTDHSPPIVVCVKGDAIALATAPAIELDLARFPNGRWALQLDDGFAWRESPVAIVAHGLACHAVAWWAQLSPRRYLSAVSGALFHAPLRFRAELASAAAAMQNGPRYRLPFASVVLGDGWFAAEETLALADRWGSCFVASGAQHFGGTSNRHAPLGAIERMLLDHAGQCGLAGSAAPPSSDAPPSLNARPHD